MSDPAKKIAAPLGSKANRYAPRLDRREKAALDILDAFFAEHPGAWVAFSGGKDSTAVLDLARRVNPWVKVAFFDSGLEFPQTTQYVNDLVESFGLELSVYPAFPDALTILERTGYWEHGRFKVKENLQEALINRPLRRATKSLGMFSIYGLRAAESKERHALLAKHQGVVPHHTKGQLDRVAAAPIWQWEHDEVHAYLAGRGVPLNPLYAQQIRLGIPERRARVGLLVDGNELAHGRWAYARQLAPDLARLVETRLPVLAQYR